MIRLWLASEKSTYALRIKRVIYRENEKSERNVKLAPMEGVNKDLDLKK